MKNREIMAGREVRTFVSDEMRVVRADDESPKIVGHALVFNSPTQIGGDDWGFMESIAPGACSETIKVDDIRALFNHNPDLILGRNVAGTLKPTHVPMQEERYQQDHGQERVEKKVESLGDEKEQ